MSDVPRITILNAMAGSEFEPALDRHVDWGLRDLDLKDHIFGKGILELSDDEAARARELIEARGLSVHCLSTGLFFEPIELGEAHFRNNHSDRVDGAIEIARILRPTFIRLLAPQTERRKELDDAFAYIQTEHPWLIGQFRDAAERIAGAGFRATVENEVHGCVFSRPEEVSGFFGTVDSADLSFTWDVQNMWQLGTAPTLDIYAALKPHIGYLHLKGGMQESGGALQRSSLADATWPVTEITRQAARDRISPVICLNPSHGERKTGYDYENIVERDIRFVRDEVLSNF